MAQGPNLMTAMSIHTNSARLTIANSSLMATPHSGTGDVSGRINAPQLGSAPMAPRPNSTSATQNIQRQPRYLPTADTSSQTAIPITKASATATEMLITVSA